MRPVSGNRQWLRLPQSKAVVCAEARVHLRRLPDAVIDCTVTSPPYYQQRDYGHRGQLGQEATPEQYVQGLAEVFRECLRVTCPTGSLWLVLGDKYWNGQLLGLPWRVALALSQSGWMLRCDIIWHKPNAMPSAAKTRPTVDHEYVFFFTRRADGYLLRCGCHSRAPRDFHRAEPHARRPPPLSVTAKVRPSRARTAETRTCTTDAGIRRFIREAAIAAPSGPFRSPNSETLTLPSSPNPWWRRASWQVALGGAGARSVSGEWHDGRGSRTSGSPVPGHRLRAALL